MILQSPVPTDSPHPQWICCQLGAREHYAVPRALLRQGRLSRLITDAWMPPDSPLQALPGERSQRLSERFHPELDGKTTDFTWSLVANELRWRAQSLGGWQLFMARNRWFQHRAASALRDLRGQHVVFAHSYAAREIFEHARQRGWRCVLGQIDPGERHFAVVDQAIRLAPDYGPPPPSPPAEYFQHWRQECALADHIVVNSEWSRQCLQEAGVPAPKIAIAPLAYEAEQPAAEPRDYPSRFTTGRPLRLLFVGHVTVAKGIKPLLEATALLPDAPIQLTVVGERSARIPAAHLADPRIHWVGAVSRREVMRHYQAADVLVFPSYSDGFGMAQIEAQGWRLPVVASPHSGRVVSDGINGVLLPEVTAEAIAGAVRDLLADPHRLAEFSRASGVEPGQGLNALGHALIGIEARA
ncbi:MAG: hypothetical protein RLZZ53_1753 [Acidobacteriota bacterium]